MEGTFHPADKTQLSHGDSGEVALNPDRTLKLSQRVYTDGGPGAYARPMTFFTKSNDVPLNPPVRFWEVVSIAGGTVAEFGVLDPDGETPQTINYPAVVVGQLIRGTTYYLRTNTNCTMIAWY